MTAAVMDLKEMTGSRRMRSDDRGTGEEELMDGMGQ